MQNNLGKVGKMEDSVRKRLVIVTIQAEVLSKTISNNEIIGQMKLWVEEQKKNWNSLASIYHIEDYTIRMEK